MSPLLEVPLGAPPSRAPMSPQRIRPATQLPDPEYDARDMRLCERESALKEREQALADLEDAMQHLRMELAAQPAAPEVARTEKRRPRRRYVMVSVSPRRHRSPAKARRGRISAVSTSVGSGYASPPRSPGRKGRKSRPSCASTVSMSMEEPPPAPTTEKALFGEVATHRADIRRDCCTFGESGKCGAGEEEAAETSHFGDAPAQSLLGSLPLPVGITSWDWPLSRDEKKSLILMFDRQELMVQRDEFADQVLRLRAR